MHTKHTGTREGDRMDAYCAAVDAQCAVSAGDVKLEAEPSGASSICGLLSPFTLLKVCVH